MLNDNLLEGCPGVLRWHEKMVRTEAWKRTWARRDECMIQQGIDPATGLPKGKGFEEEGVTGKRGNA